MSKHSRREFLQKMTGLGLYSFLAFNGLSLGGCDAEKRNLLDKVNVIGAPKYKRVILLGMDGLDPKMLSLLMLKGELPNFSRLAQQGAFSPLATSLPPQSPVAWASIATGRNPGYHGVFDFLNRRVTDYMPELAVVRMNSSNFFGTRKSMFLPAMHGNSFWDYTSSQNVPSTIIRWPMTFQPKQNDTRLYAGLGVPDLKGRLGTYTFYTTGHTPSDAGEAKKTINVRMRGSTIKTYISGPKVSGLVSGDEARTDLEVTILNGDSGIRIEADGKTVIAKRRQWSDWFELKFKVGMLKTVSGIVKFYLNQLTPEFELYVTPIQINPKDPAFVISNPDGYIKELSDELGYFYTLGISEDTKALSEGKLDEEAFIGMCDEIVKEQEDMLWHELNAFREGLFSFGFFTTDRIQHMFWATKDPAHPLYDAKYAGTYGHVIDDYYRWMDRVLGKIMKNVDASTAIMAFSDHGFSTFRRAVHLNSWLAEKGFMKLTRKADKTDKEGGPLFQYVDWNNTYAYAVGFGSIYLNLAGREKEGIVEPGTRARSLMDKISHELLQLRDPKNSSRAVKQVYLSSAVYSGNFIDNSPDLVVGFRKGYRASWQTAIGGSPSRIFEDNLNKWSGDHIMDPSVVPGILLTNFKINHTHPNLMDVAPSVLSCFGMSEPNMEGKTLL